jgi:hypothetical protein
MPTRDLRAGLGGVFAVDGLHLLHHVPGGLHRQRGVAGVSTGAPQKAMTQSPMYLSMVPRRRG